MPSIQERFYLYIDKTKAEWIKKQSKKARVSSSAFLTALVEDKLTTDKEFCPSRTFINLSPIEQSAKRR